MIALFRNKDRCIKLQKNGISHIFIPVFSIFATHQTLYLRLINLFLLCKVPTTTSLLLLKVFFFHTNNQPDRSKQVVFKSAKFFVYCYINMFKFKLFIYDMGYFEKIITTCQFYTYLMLIH